jgi:hypothetical protein
MSMNVIDYNPVPRPYCDVPGCHGYGAAHRLRVLTDNVIRMTDDFTDPIDETELDSNPGDEKPEPDEPPEDDPGADHEPTEEN